MSKTRKIYTLRARTLQSSSKSLSSGRSQSTQFFSASRHSFSFFSSATSRESNYPRKRRRAARWERNETKNLFSLCQIKELAGVPPEHISLATRAEELRPEVHLQRHIAAAARHSSSLPFCRFSCARSSWMKIWKNSLRTRTGRWWNGTARRGGKKTKRAIIISWYIINQCAHSLYITKHINKFSFSYSFSLPQQHNTHLFRIHSNSSALCAWKLLHFFSLISLLYGKLYCIFESSEKKHTTTHRGERFYPLLL